MKYQLTAPPYLLAQLATRLALTAQTLQYSLCTPPSEQSDADTPNLIFQADFFHNPIKNSASIDVFVLPSPLSSMHGFMLAAGGNHAALAEAAPILDALSPIASGWLHAGDYGSASFFHQLWQILIGAHADSLLPIWENMRAPNSGFQINHPDLVNQLSSLMAQQQLLTQSLASCSQLFLAEHPPQIFTAYHPLQKQLLSQDDTQKPSPAHEIATLLSSFKINP
ncbi:hypothetical protein K4H28_05245 [Deefgea tanakiae]|uniref:Uncharacterized protein n=1 Tax=Deefgea tanakiae TaxID=2865840 RepID=A0ABX8ZAJ0_9NEIS|nr:hypothetical protein [Deefgea tanakiae]QZA78815.1 hypothetical protein K4H28_05245 [Deefgea tanakiae]